jgi:hypothetical protein
MSANQNIDSQCKACYPYGGNIIPTVPEILDRHHEYEATLRTEVERLNRMVVANEEAGIKTAGELLSLRAEVAAVWKDKELVIAERDSLKHDLIIVTKLHNDARAELKAEAELHRKCDKDKNADIERLRRKLGE